MLKFKTSCAVLANLSSTLLNEVGLSLFRYFEVGLRVCDIVVNKYVRYLISWWVLVTDLIQFVFDVSVLYVLCNFYCTALLCYLVLWPQSWINSTTTTTTTGQTKTWGQTRHIIDDDENKKYNTCTVALLTFTDALVRFMNSRRLLSSVLSILKCFGFFSTISNHVSSEINKLSNTYS